MNYIIAGVCIAVCLAAIIFGLRVLKENRKFISQKKDDDDDDDELLYRP